MSLARLVLRLYMAFMKTTSRSLQPIFGACVRLLFIVGLSAVLCNSALAQFSIASYFPPGVTINNVTPDQFSEAVFNAARENPANAPEIAAMSFESVIQAGRYNQTGGKQDTDPDGGTSDPTVEEWSNLVTDAATRAAPEMANQISQAVGTALTSTQTAIANGTLPSDPGGTPTTPPGDPGPTGDTTGGPPPVVPVAPGGGGSGQQPASN